MNICVQMCFNLCFHFFAIYSKKWNYEINGIYGNSIAMMLHTAAAFFCIPSWASEVTLVVKIPAASAGDIRDAGLILWSGRTPGGRHGNPVHYCCLDNPMDRGACRRLQWL